MQYQLLDMISFNYIYITKNFKQYQFNGTFNTLASVWRAKRTYFVVSNDNSQET